VAHVHHQHRGARRQVLLLVDLEVVLGEVQVVDVPGLVEPRTGEINYSSIAVALTAMGYSGTVGLEAYASGEDEVALGRFSAAFGVSLQSGRQHRYRGVASDRRARGRVVR